MAANVGNVNHQLTERECEVLDLLGTDLNNTEIGNELGLSNSAVRKLLSSAYTKLGVSGRAAAAAAYAAYTGEGSKVVAKVLNVKSTPTGKSYTADDLRKAARELVSVGGYDRATVNGLLGDLLAVLGE